MEREIDGASSPPLCPIDENRTFEIPNSPSEKMASLIKPQQREVDERRVMLERFKMAREEKKRYGLTQVL